jgi:hypothetical protein
MALAAFRGCQLTWSAGLESSSPISTVPHGAVEHRAFAGDGVRGGAAAIQPQRQGIQCPAEHQRIGESGDGQ